MHEFFLSKMRVSSLIVFRVIDAGILAGDTFLAACVVFLLEEQIGRPERIVLSDLVNAFIVALREQLVQFSFGDDTGEDLKIVHEFGKLRKGDLVFGL